MARGLIIDSFAGGGGAGLGISRALGRHPDIAINHDAGAIEMYGSNLPGGVLLKEDVWHSDMRKLTRGRKVAILWASPDCKHFSRAKGSKPVEKNIRSLAWVVVKWAEQVRPAVIFLENVREFADWSPIVPAWRCAACNWRGTEGQATLIRVRRKCPRCESKRLKITDELIPDPFRKGLTFRRWVGRLRSLGYVVDHRNLNAADYGAPTHRRRLFLVARCDTQPIEWPEPTHGDPKKLEGQPLFDRLKPWRTAAECIDWSIPCPSIFDRKRPLKEATLRRIAMGIKRYVLDNPRPFIVGVGGRAGQSPATDSGAPLGTVTGKADKAIVVPHLMPVTHSGDRKPHSADDPMPTITGAHRGEFALIAPTIVRYNSEKSPGDNRSEAIDSPLSTADTQNRFALVTAFLAKHFGGMVGVEVDTPLPTTTSKGCQNQIVAASLVHMNHGDKQWSGVEEPLRAVTSNNHAALVYSFLVRYFGTAIGQHVTEPLFTITGKDRFGLVTVTIDGELYIIADIGMRMLMPRELARAQGFPDSWMLTGTKTNQVARIGNSVCPAVAEAIVRANMVHQEVCV